MRVAPGRDYSPRPHPVFFKRKKEACFFSKENLLGRACQQTQADETGATSHQDLGANQGAVLVDGRGVPSNNTQDLR